MSESSNSAKALFMMCLVMLENARRVFVNDGTHGPNGDNYLQRSP